MDNPVLITDPDQFQQLAGSNLPWTCDLNDFVQHRPDAHWVWLGPSGLPTARCSLWWRKTPPYPGHRVGLIGHYASANAGAGERILLHAVRELARRGVTLAIGPMDGSTWHRYRLVIEHGNHPPFFLEPTNPADWPAHWTAAGFDVFATYCSRLNTNLDFEDPRAREAGQRLQQLGVSLRPLDLDNFELELERLHPMIINSFRAGLLYTLIDLEAFIDQYRALQRLVKPQLVTIAEHNAQPVGLIFAVPDFLQVARGELVDTAIIKTLVISSHRAYAGLGSYLAAENQKLARSLGYQKVIHALMHQSSKSLNISARYGPILRRYALLAKIL